MSCDIYPTRCGRIPKVRPILGLLNGWAGCQCAVTITVAGVWIALSIAAISRTLVEAIKALGASLEPTTAISEGSGARYRRWQPANSSP